jgi:hypothetical protein
MLNALVDNPLNRANERIDKPRSWRNSLNLFPTSIARSGFSALMGLSSSICNSFKQ